MSHLLYPSVLLAGVLFGFFGLQSDFLSQHSLSGALLYLLVVQVGIGIGMRPDLKLLAKSLNLKVLMLPLFTIAGTLAFMLPVAMIFHDDQWRDIMAVGSGFGYYSLSSVLIGQIKLSAGHVEAAASVAAVALLANVVREVIALCSCRWLSKRGKGFVAISVAGITSIDVCLPMILGDGHDSDPQLLTAAIFHGIALEISVPVLVTLFCT